MQLQVKVLQFCVWMSPPKYGPVYKLSPRTEMLCNADLFTKADVKLSYCIIRLLQFVLNIFMCVSMVLCMCTQK